jgi:hypothetical protein
MIVKAMFSFYIYLKVVAHLAASMKRNVNTPS